MTSSKQKHNPPPTPSPKKQKTPIKSTNSKQLSPPQPPTTNTTTTTPKPPKRKKPTQADLALLALRNKPPPLRRGVLVVEIKCKPGTIIDFSRFRYLAAKEAAKREELMDIEDCVEGEDSECLCGGGEDSGGDEEEGEEEEGEGESLGDCDSDSEEEEEEEGECELFDKMVSKAKSGVYDFDKKIKLGDYNYKDDFIDDSEFIKPKSNLNKPFNNIKRKNINDDEEYNLSDEWSSDDTGLRPVEESGYFVHKGPLPVIQEEVVVFFKSEKGNRKKGAVVDKEEDESKHNMPMEIDIIDCKETPKKAKPKLNILHKATISVDRIGRKLNSTDKFIKGEVNYSELNKVDSKYLIKFDDKRKINTITNNIHCKPISIEPNTTNTKPTIKKKRSTSNSNKVNDSTSKPLVVNDISNLVKRKINVNKIDTISNEDKLLVDCNFKNISSYLGGDELINKDEVEDNKIEVNKPVVLWEEKMISIPDPMVAMLEVLAVPKEFMDGPESPNFDINLANLFVELEKLVKSMNMTFRSKINKPLQTQLTNILRVHIKFELNITGKPPQSLFNRLFKIFPYERSGLKRLFIKLTIPDEIKCKEIERAKAVETLKNIINNSNPEKFELNNKIKDLVSFITYLDMRVDYLMDLKLSKKERNADGFSEMDSLRFVLGEALEFFPNDFGVVYLDLERVYFENLDRLPGLRDGLMVDYLLVDDDELSDAGDDLGLVGESRPGDNSNCGYNYGDIFQQKQQKEHEKQQELTKSLIKPKESKVNFNSDENIKEFKSIMSIYNPPKVNKSTTYFDINDGYYQHLPVLQRAYDGSRMAKSNDIGQLLNQGRIGQFNFNNTFNLIGGAPNDGMLDRVNSSNEVGSEVIDLTSSPSPTR